MDETNLLQTKEAYKPVTKQIGMNNADTEQVTKGDKAEETINKENHSEYKDINGKNTNGTMDEEADSESESNVSKQASERTKEELETVEINKCTKCCGCKRYGEKDKAEQETDKANINTDIQRSEDVEADNEEGIQVDPKQPEASADIKQAHEKGK